MLTAKTKLHTKNKRRDHRKEHVAGVWGSPHRLLQTSCGRRQGRRAADQLCGLSGTHGYSKFRTQYLQRSCFLPQSEKKNKRNHTWAPGDLSPSHSAFRNPHHGLSRTCARALAVGGRQHAAQLVALRAGPGLPASPGLQGCDFPRTLFLLRLSLFYSCGSESLAYGCLWAIALNSLEETRGKTMKEKRALLQVPEPRKTPAVLFPCVSRA